MKQASRAFPDIWRGRRPSAEDVHPQHQCMDPVTWATSSRLPSDRPPPLAWVASSLAKPTLCPHPGWAGGMQLRLMQEAPGSDAGKRGRTSTWDVRAAPSPVLRRSARSHDHGSLPVRKGTAHTSPQSQQGTRLPARRRMQLNSSHAAQHLLSLQSYSPEVGVQVRRRPQKMPAKLRCKSTCHLASC